MRLGAWLIVFVVGCGKRSPPPPAPPVVEAPPPATPNGVVGCGDSYLAIPNETMTDFIVVQVDHGHFGSHVKLPLDGAVNGINVTLDVFESAPDGEAYCTDYGTNTKKSERYVAVAGELVVIRKGDRVSVTIDHARFVVRQKLAQSDGVTQ